MLKTALFRTFCARLRGILLLTVRFEMSVIILLLYDDDDDDDDDAVRWMRRASSWFRRLWSA